MCHVHVFVSVSKGCPKAAEGFCFQQFCFFIVSIQELKASPRYSESRSVEPENSKVHAHTSLLLFSLPIF